jgi:hypothetical protein
VLGPEFGRIWGRPRGKVMPEHLEAIGGTGSGKTTLMREMLLDRVRRRGTHVVMIATKPDDNSMSDFGWPIVDSWRDVERNEQCIFWPRTKALGQERKKFQAARIGGLLDRLWHPESNTVVGFDEWVYVEGLNADLKAVLNMYLREGRALGITCAMGKQRTQGTQRDMHSESDWKYAFKLNDDDDNERLAQLFGRKRDWVDVIHSLDREKFEFLIQHKLTGDTFISWVDKITPVQRQPTGYTR